MLLLSIMCEGDGPFLYPLRLWTGVISGIAACASGYVLLWRVGAWLSLWQWPQRIVVLAVILGVWWIIRLDYRPWRRRHHLNMGP